MDNDTKQFIQQEHEKLASMIAGGFAETDRKFAEVDGKLTDLRVEMNERFDILERRLDRMEKSHDYRITTLERDVADLRT